MRITRTAAHPAREDRLARELARSPEAVERAWRSVARMLPSEDLARDVAQECLLCLLTRGEVPRDLTGWIVRGAVPRGLQVLRSERRRRLHEERYAARRGELSDDADPLLRLEREETVLAVRRAICGLCPEHRTVIELRELEGRDYKAIAAELRVPVGTVRSRLSRARAALAGSLERQGSAGPGRLRDAVTASGPDLGYDRDGGPDPCKTSRPGAGP